MSQNSHLVRMVDISKKFGAVQALDRVSIEVGYGEVLALLGDNGAGKSTLVKILSGVFPADQGEIYFDGQRVNFSSPQEARNLGIETVYQQLSLVGIMNLPRNFFLGRELTRKIGPIATLDIKRMGQECEKVLEEIGVRVRSPEDFVSVLSGGERQAISIGRAMYFGARLLILDEPMSALSVKETRVVIEHIKKAKESGASIIFITHNVYHAYPVADRFVVLERGVKIEEVAKKDATPEDIIEVIATGKGLEV
jgi:simple sugar transport system ATP-binding protein